MFKRFYIAIFLVVSTWYVDSTATGSANGTSQANAWTTLAAISQAGLTAGDVVLIQGPATYSERLAISKSGSSSSARITYKGVGSPIIRGINGSTFNYIGVIGLHFFSGSDSFGYSSILLNGASGWLIQDNIFDQTTGTFTAVELHFETTNTNNIIRGNRFVDLGLYGTSPAGANCIIAYGDHNLIEYNTFGRGLDRCYCILQSSIVRNNYDMGTDENMFPAAASFPVHIDDVQGAYVTNTYLTARLFVSRNYWVSNASRNSHSVLIQDASGTGLCTGNVIRQNVSIGTGSGFCTSAQGLAKFRLVNNTVAQSLSAATTAFNNTITFGSPTSDDVVINNNTFYATNCSSGQALMSNTNTTNFTADYNHVFANGSLSYGTHNLTSDPLFTNHAINDYTLGSSSPLRSAATALTTANGAGVATVTLVVNDATCFCDGFGIADADFIKIGSNGYVQISSVNYATNTITLVSAQSWSDGATVTLKGAEDIGALPYSLALAVSVINTTPFMLSAGSQTLSATVANADAVRFVQFLVDGIPVGEVYAAPYQVSWTSDGGSHVVTARAYAAWPGTKLWAQQDNVTSGQFTGSGSAAFTGSGSVSFG